MVVKTKSLGTRSITYLSFRRAESASGTPLTGLRLLLLIGLHFRWRFHPKAESAQGIAPRAAHRTGRKPLDLSGSCHRLKAAAFRQDPSAPPVSG